MSATNPETDASKVFRDGIAAFRRAQYEQSILAFDRALCLVSNTTDSQALRINILDSRAAAKEKFNDLKGGIRDAKSIIDLAPQSLKGYLRAARLFRKIGKLPASIKMFKLAISKSKKLSDGSFSSKIIQIEGELGEVIELEKALLDAERRSKINYSGILPFEIFILAMSYLDTRSRFNCMAVCSSWRKIILSTPSLWTSLHLKYGHKTNRSVNSLLPKIKFWLDRLGDDKKLESLTITRGDIRDVVGEEDMFKLLIPNAWDNRLTSKLRLRHLKLDFQISTNSSNPSHCYKLVHQNRTSLVDLEITFLTRIVFKGTLHSLLAPYPRLQSLSIQGDPNATCFHFLPSFTASIDLIGSQNLDMISGFDTPSLASEPDQSSRLPSVKSLILNGLIYRLAHMPPLRLESLRHFTCSSTSTRLPGDNANDDQILPIDPTQLSELNVMRQRPEPPPETPLWTGFKSFPNLEILRLCHYTHFLTAFLQGSTDEDDDTAENHDHHKPIAPRLRLLDLSLVPSDLSYRFLSRFAHQFIQLESLSLSGIDINRSIEPLVIQTFKYLPALINLSLSNSRASSKVIDSIKAGRLMNLDVQNCDQVNFKSLSRLIGNEMVKLNICGCHLISTREMIDWLANRVTHLIWKFNEDSRKNKCVRRLVL